jgi:hypothetical protein
VSRLGFKVERVVVVRARPLHARLCERVRDELSRRVAADTADERRPCAEPGGRDRPVRRAAARPELDPSVPRRPGTCSGREASSITSPTGDEVPGHQQILSTA